MTYYFLRREVIGAEDLHRVLCPVLMGDMIRAFEVLLVEDEEADAYLIKKAFKESCILIHIHHVLDGVEAMEYLQSRDMPQPDLILLDLNMPRMNGREFLKEMKEDEDLQHIPVVVLTTSDVEGDIVTTYQLGASGFITKPVDLTQFMDSIKQMGNYWFALVKLPGDLS